MLGLRPLLAASLLSLSLAGCGDDSNSATPSDDGTSGELPTSSGSTGSDTSGPDASTGAADETGGGAPDFDGARMVFEPLVRAQCEQGFSCCDSDAVSYTHLTLPTTPYV